MMFFIPEQLLRQWKVVFRFAGNCHFNGRRKYKHYETAAIIARQLVMKLSANRLPSQTILNVNVPNLPLDEIKGIQVTRLGTRHSAEPIMKEFDPRGGLYIGLVPGMEADAGLEPIFTQLIQDMFLSRRFI